MELAFITLSGQLVSISIRVDKSCDPHCSFNDLFKAA